MIPSNLTWLYCALTMVVRSNLNVLCDFFLLRSACLCEMYRVDKGDWSWTVAIRTESLSKDPHVSKHVVEPSGPQWPSDPQSFTLDPAAGCCLDEWLILHRCKKSWLCVSSLAQACFYTPLRFCECVENLMEVFGWCWIFKKKRKNKICVMPLWNMLAAFWLEPIKDCPLQVQLIAEIPFNVMDSLKNYFTTQSI